MDTGDFVILMEATTCLISVKGGGIKPGDIRDLKGTMFREKAVLGLFLTLKSKHLNSSVRPWQFCLMKLEAKNTISCKFLR